MRVWCNTCLDISALHVGTSVIVAIAVFHESRLRVCASTVVRLIFVAEKRLEQSQARTLADASTEYHKFGK